MWIFLIFCQSTTNQKTQGVSIFANFKLSFQISSGLTTAYQFISQLKRGLYKYLNFLSLHTHVLINATSPLAVSAFFPCLIRTKVLIIFHNHFAGQQLVPLISRCIKPRPIFQPLSLELNLSAKSGQKQMLRASVSSGLCSYVLHMHLLLISTPVSSLQLRLLELSTYCLA